jgi:hypothetical protein
MRGLRPPAQMPPHFRGPDAPMRNAVRAGSVLFVLLAAYTVWPFVDLYRLARAIESRDVAALSRQVEFGAVQTSVTRQVLRTYLALSGQEQRVPAFARDALVSTVAASVQPALAQLVTPERMVDFFAEGWPKTAETGNSGSVDLFSGSFGRAWRLYLNSEYRFRNFDVSVPAEVEPKRRFRLQLYLIQWRWKLYAVELPEEIRVRAAQELIKATIGK